MAKQYNSATDFYPFYLGEHKNYTCRLLHFIGTTLVILLSSYIALTGDLRKLIFLPLVGYGFAWLGHFAFEKNKPATFKYPLFSYVWDWFASLTLVRLICDFIMWKDILLNQKIMFDSKRK